MVWSSEDFYREVRRQLVELESVRRKLKLRLDVQANLAKLEESQLYLLRKLENYFQSEAAAAKEQAGAIPPAVGEFLKELLAEPEVHEQLAISQVSSDGDAIEDLAESIQKGLSVLLMVIQPSKKPSPLGEDTDDIPGGTCPNCGKSLVPILLAGGGVLQDGGDWYHKDCRQGLGGNFWQPYSLN